MTEKSATHGAITLHIPLDMSTSTALPAHIASATTLEIVLPDIHLGANFSLATEDTRLRAFLNVRRPEDATMDEFDKWVIADETPGLLSQYPATTPQSIEAARREALSAGRVTPFGVPIGSAPPSTARKDVIEEEIPLDIGIGAMTPITSPLRDETFGGEGMGGFEEDVPRSPLVHGEVPTTPGLPGAEVPTAKPTAPTRTGIKRGRVIEDDSATYDIQAVRDELNNTSPIKRQRRFAASTREEFERVMTEPQTFEEMMRLPNASHLSSELRSLFDFDPKKLTKKTAAETEVGREQAAQEELPGEFGGFDLGAPDERETSPAVPISTGRKSEIPPFELGAMETTTLPEDRIVENEFDAMLEGGVSAPATVERTVVRREARRRERQREEELGTKFADEGLTDRSKKVLGLFKQTFEQHNNANISFFTMLEGRQRITAARCFYELLVLKSKDLVTVEQAEPYGDIIIGSSDRLMEA